uniref:Uncharacterized protein n=1 Tax=Panagrolaimus sp. JU765 TaxID=591449 RepID=A0AC34QVP2_9BILA
MLLRFLGLLFLFASANALITFADLCFHSRQDYLLCRNNMASAAKARFGSDFFAGIDPEIANKFVAGFDTLPTPGKRGYDFIRFGRSPNQKKKSGSHYDYIRFGKR